MRFLPQLSLCLDPEDLTSMARSLCLTGRTSQVPAALLPLSLVACLRIVLTAANLASQEGWTSSDRLAIHGRSAGGMTMGAAVTMSPDTFKARRADSLMLYPKASNCCVGAPACRQSRTVNATSDATQRHRPVGS